jgi:hypothetical protein
MKKIMMAAFAVLILSGAAFAADARFSGTGKPGGAGSGPEEREWINEFNDVCSATTASMALSKDELNSHIRSADALKGRLGCLGDSAKKVYSRRLRMCHDMYEFALDAKVKEDKK